VKSRTRYATLLFAGFADLFVGIYALTLVIFGNFDILEFTWMTATAFLTLFTGSYLTYRTLQGLMSPRPRHAALIQPDERTKQILHRAARNAFVFLVVALPVVVTTVPEISRLGLVLTLSDAAATTMMAWIVAIIIFYASIVSYYRT